MARTRAAEHTPHGHGHGGATPVAPPASPLDLVQAAMAGGELTQILARTAERCGRSVALSLPAVGLALHHPSGAVATTVLAALEGYAAALLGGPPAGLPDAVHEAVEVRVGDEAVGVIAAVGPGPAGVATRPWLEGAAAATAVSTLLAGQRAPEAGADRRVFLEQIEFAGSADIGRRLADGRRLGADLGAGAIGICALWDDLTALAVISELGQPHPGEIIATTGHRRLLGLVALHSDQAETRAEAIVSSLRAAGTAAARSGPHSDPGQLQEALAEAALLAEVYAGAPDAATLVPQEETLRLLVGVLLRSPEELLALRTASVAELERYDELHDTELVATLQAFLAHHGSTTETAEAMSLHRHTVGYRLARVQEVSGLSPYDSEGRERLSLGLKADRILAAERRRSARVRQG